MTAPVITIGPEASVPVAVRLLARHGIKRLSVVEENRLVGHLERKSLVQMAVHLTRTVPGVVDVVSRLGFELDDDRLPLPPVPLLP